MIIDNLSNALIYEGIHPRLKKALHYLQENDLNALEVGKYNIEDENIFLLIQEYNTKTIDEGRFESHYQYTDIQCVVQGEEKMAYTNVENVTKLEEENKENDIKFYEANGDFFLVKAGQFAIFTPQDAHMPGICIDEPKPIKKALMKVLCD